jgi:hypothetical protein
VRWEREGERIRRERRREDKERERRERDLAVGSRKIQRLTHVIRVTPTSTTQNTAVSEHCRVCFFAVCFLKTIPCIFCLPCVLSYICRVI